MRFIPFMIAAFLALPVAEPDSRPKAASRPTITAETQRMVRRLRELAENADPQKVYHLNRLRAQMLNQRANASKNPSQQIKLALEFALECVRAGNPELAIRQIQILRDAFERNDVHVGDNTREYMGRFMVAAYLRLAEQQNCQHCETGESCLFPISRAGIHAKKEGARHAINEIRALLISHPDDLGLRWLLNLCYMTLGEYPASVPGPWLIPPKTFESTGSVPRFRDVAIGVGAAVNGLSGGCAVDDFDGDGLLDIVASSWGFQDQVRILRNRGDGRFDDATERGGLTGIVGGLNLIHGDYDNDGDLDVYILRGAWLGDQGQQPNSLLQNQGDGRFADVTESSGLLSAEPTQSAVWLDYDNDGDLDLFVGVETSRRFKGPCRLYQNDGAGKFRDVADAAGVAFLGFVKGVTAADYDNDGRMDLYLSVLGMSNVLFRNNGPSTGGPWTFTNVAARAGVERPIRSFPTWFFDYDNDGHEDLFVATFSGFDGESLGKVVADLLNSPKSTSHCRLYRNNGDGTFRDASREMGVDRLILAMGCNFGDLDNDGWLDCYMGTGEPDMLTLIPNVMLRNDHGRRFQDVTTVGGFGHLQKGHGIAFADVDNDGDQDIYAVLGGAYEGDAFRNALFENPGSSNHWLTLKLTGARSNRFAVGARIHVVVDTPAGRRHIHRTVTTGGSFGSGSLQEEIGLGDATAVHALHVTWPATGMKQRWSAPPMDATLEIHEDRDDFVVVKPPRVTLQSTPPSP